MKPFLVLILFLGASCAHAGSPDLQDVQEGARPAELLSQSDAESILGEPCRLADSLSQSGAGVHTYRCSFAAHSAQAERTGNLYFLYERYDKPALAQKKYSATRSANEENGIIVLEDVGDEAYFHSDNENFCFIMVRKGNTVINMKVSKITPTMSLDDFHRVARKITAAL